MNKKQACIAGILLLSGAAQAGHAVHWGYQGEEGPQNWGQLSPDFRTCALGRNQSPVDLHDLVEAELPPLGIEYWPGASEVVNNGHTIQVNYRPGSRLVVDGHEFELKQFHFHSPSENRIQGRSFPMEAHLVHSDRDGNLAVVAVMFEEGAPNPVLDGIWSRMPEKAGDGQALPKPANVADLLPKDRDYYRFNGSLTTPPCTEGVWWLVMKHPVTASRAQIEKFTKVMHHPNNRPVQPVNARPLLK